MPNDTTFFATSSSKEPATAVTDLLLCIAITREARGVRFLLQQDSLRIEFSLKDGEGYVIIWNAGLCDSSGLAGSEPEIERLNEVIREAQLNDLGQRVIRRLRLMANLTHKKPPQTGTIKLLWKDVVPHSFFVETSSARFGESLNIRASKK